jgi:hypothetical protein
MQMVIRFIICAIVILFLHLRKDACYSIFLKSSADTNLVTVDVYIYHHKYFSGFFFERRYSILFYTGVVFIKKQVFVEKTLFFAFYKKFIAVGALFYLSLAYNFRIDKYLVIYKRNNLT